MKRIGIALLAAIVAMGSFANPKALQKTWLKGTTDKAPIYYKSGETMVFTIEPQEVKGELPAGKYFLQWERTGDDGVEEKGKEPFTGKPFVYKTSIAKPGFVRLYAIVVDENGQPFKKKKPSFKGDPNSPEGRVAYRRYKKIRRNIIFDGGAAADIDSLQQGAPEPKDFDAFWAKQKEALAKVPFNAKRIERESGNSMARLYAVSVDCTGGMPVTGYLSIPKAAEKGEKFPIRIEAFGYGVGEQHAPRKPSAKAIDFRINAHGFLLREFGGTDEYYKTYGEKISSNGYSYAFDPIQNSNPETSYFRGMILRMIRAIQYAKSLPEWDGKTIEVSGSSQGGGFAIWAAGCGEGVTRAFSTVTGFCDHGKELVGRLQGKWPRIKYVEALGYFDAVNFAKRIPATCRVDIPRAGLGDYTCEPSGIAILWNNLKCPKTILWMQGSQHSSNIPPEYEGRDTIRKQGVDK
jgi:cephalosporin-C deacetylase-like acetyl esterase